jgi:outer membrane lipoprotein-sorting protein
MCGFSFCEKIKIPSEILEKYKSRVEKEKSSEIKSAEELILAVNKKIESLKSYNAHIEYLFEQPLFESSTLRKGRMYFVRQEDSNSTKLAVDFRTVKQDEQPQEIHRERYVFDGVWLNHLDYKLKQIEKRQLSKPNEPKDVFELASKSFPIVGFSKMENLEKDFDIELKKSEKDRAIKDVHLLLKVKEGSDYNDYENIKIWISKKTLLPKKIIALTAEEDIYNIRFFAPQINKEIPERVFKVSPPAGFSEPRVIRYRQKDEKK